jgi:hypothetical protein
MQGSVLDGIVNIDSKDCDAIVRGMPRDLKDHVEAIR